MTNTDKPNYWALLGLKPTSNSNDLKVAFRKEARKWHPDLNKNDINAEERFKLINEAYVVLSDPIKRKAWEGNNSFTHNLGDQFKYGFPSFENYIHIILGIPLSDEVKDDKVDDFEYTYPFSEVTNNQNSNDSYDSDIKNDFWPEKSTINSKPIKIEEDIETLVELSIEEAFNGAEIEIETNSGSIVLINTPPLAGDGWRLRLEGVAPGGKDHFIQLRVQTVDGLRIDGLRVLYRLELYPPEALLGCAVDVPTLNGYVTLQVPPKSSSGRLLRLKGRGLTFNEYCGDQYVEIVIVMPDEVSDSEIALYKRLQEIANNFE